MKQKSVFPFILCGTLCSANVIAQQNIDPEQGSENTAVIFVEPKKVKQVSVTEVKSADLAEVLGKKIPGISVVRRSGIANDIILRGQKKDNINILIDNAKVYGACPNRMDPPTSHVLTNNIENIVVTEGPYDVENFGTLSGAVKVTTKMPSKDFKGSVSLNLGSWDYEKFAATLSGGSEKVRAMISVSQETGGQYEDGDGNDFSDQIEAFTPGSMVNYKPEYSDIDAYEKSTVMGKVYAIVSDNQEMEVSYTANRSDDVLYPSSKMDALYDDSDIFNLAYRILDIGNYSDELEIQFYNSTVEHPMSTFYRVSSGTNSVNEVISYLETETQGLKFINHKDLSSTSKLKVGIDIGNRNWDGEYEGFGSKAGITGVASIPDVDTENRALFMELNNEYSNHSIQYGLRIDDTEITQADNTLKNNDYSATSAFIFGTYQLNDSSKLFAGIGRASRVPDARELYFHASMGGGTLKGNPDLNDTINNEIDFGIETHQDDLFIKTKVFYSALKDFIYYNATRPTSNMMVKGGFDNVDASVYGLDVSGNYTINPQWDVDFGLALQKGEKDEALSGQTDTNLAEIPPMKANAAINYAYRDNSLAMIEIIAADSWDNFDADNGEQKLDSWAVMNLKLKHQFNEQFGITTGIDNVFDETYAVSNTYKDLTLLTDGSDVMLMNEPGRYIYLNAVYSF